MSTQKNMYSQSYALATGNKGAKRLSLQNEVLKELSQKFLITAGLTKGMTVIDLACGNGTMTSFLAQAVGESGHVYAVDISTEQLELAKEHVTANRCNNVTFIQDDITCPQNLPKNKASIVYARFILMHLTSPLNAIMNMKSLLLPKGIIANEEAIKHSTFSSYQTEILNNYMQAVIALGKTLGVDYDIGDKLEAYYRQSNCKIRESYFHQQQIKPIDAKYLFTGSIAELKEKILVANIATSDKIALWENSFQGIPENDTSQVYMLSKQAYVIAQI